MWEFGSADLIERPGVETDQPRAVRLGVQHDREQDPVVLAVGVGGGDEQRLPRVRPRLAPPPDGAGLHVHLRDVRRQARRAVGLGEVDVSVGLAVDRAVVDHRELDRPPVEGRPSGLAAGQGDRVPTQVAPREVRLVAPEVRQREPGDRAVVVERDEVDEDLAVALERVRVVVDERRRRRRGRHVLAGRPIEDDEPEGRRERSERVEERLLRHRALEEASGVQPVRVHGDDDVSVGHGERVDVGRFVELKPGQRGRLTTVSRALEQRVHGVATVRDAQVEERLRVGVVVDVREGQVAVQPRGEIDPAGRLERVGVEGQRGRRLGDRRVLVAEPLDADDGVVRERPVEDLSEPRRERAVGRRPRKRRPHAAALQCVRVVAAPDEPVRVPDLAVVDPEPAEHGERVEPVAELRVPGLELPRPVADQVAGQPVRKRPADGQSRVIDLLALRAQSRAVISVVVHTTHWDRTGLEPSVVATA